MMRRARPSAWTSPTRSADRLIVDHEEAGWRCHPASFFSRVYTARVNRTEIEFPTKHAALREDVHMLGGLVGEVLRDQGGNELFELVERDRTLAIARRNGDQVAGIELQERIARRTPAIARDLERAFTTWFQMVNLAEQVHRIRRRRAYFLDDAAKPQPGGISAAIVALKESGVGLAEVLAMLGQVHVNPVFMAHPTESTRRTILRKQLRLAQILADRLNPTLAPNEQRAVTERIRAEITTGWQTEDHPRQKLTVADEREHLLFFLTEVIYPVLPDFYDEIAEAIGNTYGVDPHTLEIPAMLHFGSWVGGDMDGNPDVHAKVMRETLTRQQQAIVNTYYLEVQELAQLLSQSASRVSVSTALQQRSDEYALRMPGARSAAPARHDRMPYRVFLGQVAERLRATYEARPTAYESPRQFAQDIELLVDSLQRNRGQHAGLSAVRKLQRRITTFGFHLATLDIRQHAAIHHQVIAQALDDPTWLGLDAGERQRRLHEMIERDLGPRVELDALGKRTLAVFEAMLQCRRRFGSQSIGTYVVNDARGADDVLAAFLLARWAGAYDKTSEAVAVDLAPMFVSMGSLARSENILQALLEDPLYRRHLADRDHRQWLWVGYSQSSLESGLCASRFAVYRAQESIARVFAKVPERAIVGHARGGSIARGGGRIDAISQSSPPSSVQGQLRVTEQGEGIDQHYGLGSIALRTFERAFSALTWGARSAAEPSASAMQIAAQLATQSERGYRELVHESASFRDWFAAVTPIDVIERMQIGGRSAYREGVEGIAALRAVPWVFAWTQNRVMLPGWYGAGTGLAVVIEQFGLSTVRAVMQEWPFLSRLVDDVEVMLARADLQVGRSYLPLAEAIPQHAMLFAKIETEFERCCESILQLKQMQQLLDGDRTQQRAIALRNPYVDPMNLMQVDLLRRWRSGSREDEELFAALLASVNGIAQGLQNTG